jgi:hypothetical protein
MTDAQEQWLSALSSGKYTKGKEYLKHEVNGCVYHCCLGVACEVFKDVCEVEETRAGDCSKFGMFLTDLPTPITRLLQLRSNTGALKTKYCPNTEKGVYGIFATLTEINDGTDLTLHDIAEYIRNNYDNVFYTNTPAEKEGVYVG